jgi:hypothetical protein
MPLPNLLLVSCKIGKVRPNSESGGARSVRLVFLIARNLSTWFMLGQSYFSTWSPGPMTFMGRTDGY